MLDVQGLRMRYGAHDVLHGVTFQARQGEVLVLLGPNGAGKTTTTEVLEGFRMRSAGQVEVLAPCSSSCPGDGGMRLLVRRISFRTWPFVGVFDLGALGAAGHRRPP